MNLKERRPDEIVELAVDADGTLLTQGVNEATERMVLKAPGRGGQLLLTAGKEGNRRYLPGVASYGGGLPKISAGQTWLKGSHGNAGRIPEHIAEKLAGRKFATFDDFRKAFWTEVGNDPILSSAFHTGNRKAMRSGYAPASVPSQQLGKRVKYELDHLQEIQDGGNVYDMNNLVVRTVLNHVKGK